MILLKFILQNYLYIAVWPKLQIKNYIDVNAKILLKIN